MSKFFITIVNMSITASWIVLAIFLLRILLRKAPKWIIVLLWGIAAIRLICPFSFESFVSLIPSSETIGMEIMSDKTPEITIGISVVDDAINQIVFSSVTHDFETSSNPLQIFIPKLAMIWVTGILFLLVYTVISFRCVKKKIETAVLLRDNIYQSETIVSPFVLGIIKPQIYLPFNVKEKDLEHVIAHEQAHIYRKDYLWKPIGFLILILHWFNPLIWIGYMLFCKDIELACDGKVVREYNAMQRADYSQALLTYSVSKRISNVCPIAFGEVSIKERVKSVLNYKKPTLGIVVVTIVAGVMLAFCFLTNPSTTMNKEYSWKDIVQGESVYPIQPGTEEWDNLGTVQNKIEACRLSKSVLKKMTDMELVRAVWEYPFLLDTLLYGNDSAGVQSIRQNCDALKELLSRRTGKEALKIFYEERVNDLAEPISGREEVKIEAIKVILEEVTE